MSTTVALRRSAPPAAAALGAGWLVVRPALVSGGATTAMLAAGYLLTGLLALVVTMPPADPALVSRRTGLAVGLIAVVLAATAGGWPAPAPVHAGWLLLPLLAALAEELVFRRALYGWLAQYGPVLAVLGSAVLFALVHLPAYGTAALPVDLGAGLLLSWQRWATGGWTAPALTHLSANALAVILR